ncbi:MAG: hypothetical protein E6G39_07460 [Actinobacteria bacterium]|nr:MAG: hypothetical protein E6G39_07460 [Actinomycetota bacterium]
MSNVTPTVATRPSNVRAVVPLAVGAAVAIAIGTYGRVHDPAGRNTITLFFKDTLTFKAWTTTVAFALVIFQVVSAARIYGRLKFPKSMPAWYGDAHRLSGTLAFALTLPVNPRTVIHSVAGCFFFGLFTAKVLSVRSHKLPGWMLPVIGSLTFAALAILWATSSLWFFTNKGFPQG